MKLLLASDHAGFELKSKLIDSLSNDYNCIDLGTNSSESVDYPDYAKNLCQQILNDHQNSKGILICGSGIGMSITANRFKGIRAALAMNIEIAQLAKQHNNANVLVLAARFIDEKEAVKIVKSWLTASFEDGRHLKRIEKIDL